MIMDIVPCNCCGARDWSYCFTENGFDLGRCRVCGLHYVHPMPTLADRIADVEAGEFAGGLTISDGRLHLAQERTKRARLSGYVDVVASSGPPSGPWLDLGC